MADLGRICGLDLAPGSARGVQSTLAMDILLTLLIGLIVGVIAKFLMPGKDPGGFIVTTILGVAGAFLAGFIGRALGWYELGEAPGFIASVLGAMVILFGYRLVLGRKRR